MRIKGSLAKGLLVALILTLIPITAFSAQKITPGSTCKVFNQKVVYQNKTYTCTKAGKKLVWNKGVAVKKPTPTATPTPTPKTNDVYTAPSELTDNIDLCKIKEVNLNGPRNGRAGPEGALIPLPSGFPIVTPATQRIGTVKWALIPIDFSDLKGESNFRSRVDLQMELLTDWYFTVSEGNLKVDWSVHNNWVTLPKPSSQYTIGDSVNLMNSDAGQALFRDAMTSADPVFDFTNIQYVIFLLPNATETV